MPEMTYPLNRAVIVAPPEGVGNDQPSPVRDVITVVNEGNNLKIFFLGYYFPFDKASQLFIEFGQPP